MSADPGVRAALAAVLPPAATRKPIRVASHRYVSQDQNAEWDALSNTAQVRLAAAAMRRAAITLAGQAEALAQEMESGALSDCGGAEALRLLAIVVRTANQPECAESASG